MNTPSVDSCTITSVDLQELTGFSDVYNIATMSVDAEVHKLDPNVKIKQ